MIDKDLIIEIITAVRDNNRGGFDKKVILDIIKELEEDPHSMAALQEVRHLMGDEAADGFTSGRKAFVTDLLALVDDTVAFAPDGFGLAWESGYRTASADLVMMGLNHDEQIAFIEAQLLLDIEEEEVNCTKSEINDADIGL